MDRPGAGRNVGHGRRALPQEARAVVAGVVLDPESLDPPQEVLRHFLERPVHVGEAGVAAAGRHFERGEEHTSEIQSLMRIWYAVFCLKKKTMCQSEEGKKRKKI